MDRGTPSLPSRGTAGALPELGRAEARLPLLPRYPAGHAPERASGVGGKGITGEVIGGSSSCRSFPRSGCCPAPSAERDAEISWQLCGPSTCGGHSASIGCVSAPPPPQHARFLRWWLGCGSPVQEEAGSRSASSSRPSGKRQEAD